MSVLNERFPELGLAESEVSEMSWVESAARLAGLSSVDELTSRVSKTKYYGKNKSDYVQQPISIEGLPGGDAPVPLQWAAGGVHDHGPLRRRHGTRERHGDAVPAPRGQPVRPSVRRHLGLGRRRGRRRHRMAPVICTTGT